MIVAIIPAIALVVGLLMWRPAMKDAGKALTVTSLLITLYVLAHYTQRIP